MDVLHKHRILPGHLGGTYTPDNVEMLTISEHAEAHRLLWENFGRQADWIAWKMLSGQVGKESAEHKRKISQAHLGTKKPWAARTSQAPDVRQKISVSLSAYLQENPDVRQGENNPMFGRSRPDVSKRNRLGLSSTARNAQKEKISGRKQHINASGQRKMFHPGSAPDGWTLLPTLTAQERNARYQSNKSGTHSSKAGDCYKSK